MASNRAIRAAKAFVEVYVDNSKLQAGLARTERRIKRFGRDLRSIGANFVGGGLALAAPFVGAIKAASDFEETLNKFNVVFADNAEGVRAWGEEFAETVGRSKADVLGFLASTQDLLVPIGIDAEKAEKLSKTITGLTVDLASFNNMAEADVMRDLQAALTGSGETMKKYGVIVSQTAVNQRLLNDGLDPKEATEAEKAMARLALILDGTTAAQGDAIRSGDSFEAQTRKLKATLHDTAVEVGQTLLPVVTPWIETAVDAAKSTAEWISENRELIPVIAGVAAGSLSVGSALVVLGGTVGAAGTAFGALGAVMSGLFALAGSPFALAIAAGGAVGAALIEMSGKGDEALGGFEKAINSWGDTFDSVFDTVKAQLLSGDLEGAFKTVSEAVELEVEKLALALTGITGQLEVLYESFKAVEGVAGAFEGFLLRSPIDTTSDVKDAILEGRKGVRDKKIELFDRQSARLARIAEIQEAIRSREAQQQAVKQLLTDNAIGLTLNFAGLPGITRESLQADAAAHRKAMIDLLKEIRDKDETKNVAKF